MGVDESKLEQAKWFAQVLAKYDKIAIAGGPKTGKTTMAATSRDDRPIIHIDSYRDSWDDAPRQVMEELEKHDKWIVEGIQVGRCLRKGLKPDIVIWCEEPRKPLSPGQKTMAKGCKTIFNDWLQNGHKASDVAITPNFHVEHL